MANTAQARKRARQSDVRNEHNVALRTKLRTFIKKVISAIATGNKVAANDAYKAAQPVIDKMSSKGIIHKNKAARHKSRLNQQIKKMA